MMKIISSGISVPDSFYFWVITSFILSAVVANYTYPRIISISKVKHLFQKPVQRSSHTEATPNLGGIGIFLGIGSVSTLVGCILSLSDLLSFVGALVILFFTGLKDDLVEISPKKKLIGQLFASLIVIFLTDTRINSLFGVFGVFELPYLISILFSLFIFILLINAFNLIDGVDGLAASIGIISSIIFTFFFLIKQDVLLLIISASLIGCLFTFLFFNFSKKRKIFMGDTGSMIVGFLIAYQAINFLSYGNIEFYENIFGNAALIVFAVLSYPVMDTLRVFVIRICLKRNPFSADQNHLHHNLLLLGYKHWEISVLATLYVLLSFIFIYIFRNTKPNTTLSLIICFCAVFSVLPYLLLVYKRRINSIKNSRYKPQIHFKQIFANFLNIFL